jgi:hypothetical protein
MLFQRLGGLQVQMAETLSALRELGVEARYFDVLKDRLDQVDVLHVFSVLHGNDRIVEAARHSGIPVVLSTVLHPPFSRVDRLRAELAARITGRLTGWSVKTTYEQALRALNLASHIIALGEAERAMLIEGYRQAADRVTAIPNGVGARFFSAEPSLYLEHYPATGGVAVCIASIGPRKNQLTAARALCGLPVRLDLFGPCGAADKPYLDAVLAAAPDRVAYRGPLRYEDPMLPSAYAAARLSVLVSESEVMPISVLESLAAGTPVVMGLNHSLGLPPMPGILEMVRHDDMAAVRAACSRVLERAPERDVVRSTVRHLDWSGIGEQLLSIYRRVSA